MALERRVLAAVKLGGTTEEVEARVRPIMLAAGRGDANGAAAVKEASSPWLRVFLDHDPLPALRRLRQPVLAVYGSKDLQVPPGAHAPAMRKALAANRRAEVVELPGLNHLLQPAGTGMPQEYGKIATTMDPAALDRIVTWSARTAGLPR